MIGNKLVLLASICVIAICLNAFGAKEFSCHQFCNGTMVCNNTTVEVSKMTQGQSTTDIGYCTNNKIYEIDERPVVCLPIRCINEANATNGELWWNNCTNRTNITGWKIFECNKTTGKPVLLKEFRNITYIDPGQHLVFDWDIAPMTGDLVLVDRYNTTVDVFHYDTFLVSELFSRQRICDGARKIGVDFQTFGRPNHCS